MKIGVFTVLYADLAFTDMLDKVKRAGVQAVELGTGGNPGSAHADVDKLLNSEDARKQFQEALDARELTVSALSCHANPISPDPAEARDADETFKKTVQLASLLDIPVVNTFSGVAGSDESARHPNWPVAPWPSAYSDIYSWQWEQKLIPYWKEVGSYAKEHGIKVGIEPHGGFLVHTPYTVLKLREATNEAVGANLDPSHMWWQGIDPVAAIKILGKEGAIHHFHAKDTYIDQDNVNMYGLTDMQPYSSVQTRAWSFRSVGFGHGMKEWSDMISALRTFGYDHVVSIEHEDPIMSLDEGFERAVQNLNSVNISERPVDMWWA
ncbi:sugar phosphate isomerase/epimerase [Marinococcus halophilus]|uniref:Xylose isomerase n=1 Tax=Marinococcus halophilus TaxID=1371 RepID=A0A510Y7T9_MARHA|nr:sugar phosphate isomerase/epimerase [Marinococcus halophilus]OZT81896.1 sugar phosphate isomerase/epimerase [Marinococcus halophilus]GEK59233.1 xylose isomerase [Marinococcus halophilus]